MKAAGAINLPPLQVHLMPIPIEALEAELLRLRAIDRARLLERVIASLDADQARDEAWDRLAAERDAEMERSAEHQRPSPAPALSPACVQHCLDRSDRWRVYAYLYVQQNALGIRPCVIVSTHPNRH